MSAQASRRKTLCISGAFTGDARPAELMQEVDGGLDDPALSAQPTEARREVAARITTLF
jgi:hypothetical protein